MRLENQNMMFQIHILLPMKLTGAFFAQNKDRKGKPKSECQTSF